MGLTATACTEDDPARAQPSDDSAEFQRLLTQFAGGTIHLARRIWNLGSSTFDVPHGTTIRAAGSGLGKTTLRTTSETLLKPLGAFTIKDITFDGLGRARTLLLAPPIIGAPRARVIDCSVTGFQHTAFEFVGNFRVTVQRTKFLGGRKDRRFGAITYGRAGLTELSVEDCSFHVLRTGIGGPPILPNVSRRVTIRGNRFDGAWSCLPTEAEREIDIHGLSATLPVPVDELRRNWIIRIEQHRAMDDSPVDGSHVRGQVWGATRGDLIGDETTFGVVQHTGPDGVDVDSWLSRRSSLPAPAPRTVTRLRRPIYGKVKRVDGQTVTVMRWHDANGQTVSLDGTHLAAFGRNTVYPCLINGGFKNVTIDRNEFIRGWADQVAFFGSGATISRNIISAGQDMGITVEQTKGSGTDVVISQNRIDHQGSAAVWAGGATMTVQGNVCSNNGTATAYSDHMAAIRVHDGADVEVLDNTLIRGTATQAPQAISMSGTSERVRVSGNDLRGYGEDALLLVGSHLRRIHAPGIPIDMVRTTHGASVTSLTTTTARQSR